MEQDKQPRRVKVTNATEHRSGTIRAAVKPHKRAAEPNVKQAVATFMGNLKTRLTQTYYGSTIDKNAPILRSNFGKLAADDELYLLCDPTGTGKAGILLAKSGIHLADGRGGTLAIAWKDLPGQTIAYQRGTLTIGQSGIATTDGQTLASLLTQIQALYAK